MYQRHSCRVLTDAKCVLFTGSSSHLHYQKYKEILRLAQSLGYHTHNTFDITGHTINLEARNLLGKMHCRWNSTKNNILE